jgi:hypothetical protein
VESHIVTEVPRVRADRSLRVRLIGLLGPATAVGGIAWAFVQPYRITLLHPLGEGFWWLLVEPPLLVVAVGMLFSVVVARPLLADLEGDDAAA